MNYSLNYNTKYIYLLMSTISLTPRNIEFKYKEQLYATNK